jgi:tetratricopeptide (TPR) repeat protein
LCLVSKAIVDTMTAEFDGAAEASEQVLESSFGSLGWTGPAARSNHGSIMFERGDTDRARSWLTDAIALAESLGDHGDALLGHLDLVVIECAAGRLDAAEAQFAAALELSPEADRGSDLELLVARAELALYGGEPTRAGELAEVALARAGEMDRAHDRCRCLRRLGDAQLEAGDADRALTTFRMLVARARAAPYPCREAEGHEGAAAAAAALGRRRIAHRHLAAAAEIRDRVGTRRAGRPWLEQHLAALEAKAQQRQLSESGR